MYVLVGRRRRKIVYEELLVGQRQHFSRLLLTIV